MNIINILTIIIGIFFIMISKVIIKYYENFAAKNHKKIEGKNIELIPVICGLILIIKGLVSLIESL